MAENSSLSEKNLALDEKIAQKVVEDIEIARLNGKNQVTLGDGKSFIYINIQELPEQDRQEIKFGGKTIGIVSKGEKIPNDKVKEEIRRYQQEFDFNKAYKDLGRPITESEKNNPKSLELEQELNEAIKEGRAEKLREGREITASGEDISVLLKKMFGEKGHEIYRVRDKNDSHKFEYIAKGNDGKDFEPKGSRANEGTNARQMCWVQNKDGSFEKKTVDDMKVFGRYVIATDIADNTLTDDNRTLIGQRTPRGDYILMPALDYRIGDTSNNSNVKDNLARGNSVWEIDDVILAAELGNTIRGTKIDGKLSADEVEFIRKLKKEGLDDQRIRKIVDAALIVDELKDQGLNDASIKAILDTVDTTVEQIEELKREDYSDKEINQVMKLVHEKVDFKEAKDKIKENRDKETDEGKGRARGERPEGPWDDGKH